jgi:hypothetical protein
MNTLRRTIHPEVRVLDEKAGTVEYVASDETVDSYREVIRADGWRFDRFEKNAPFVDSHNYDSIACLLGKVVDFKVAGRKLVETVQWAKDVAENTLAQLGWRMLQGGFLPAVSVGFVPVRSLWQNDEGWSQQLAELKLDAKTDVRRVFIEQQQIELSAVVIPANPNAVAIARAYKSGALADSDIDFISAEVSKRNTANAADGSDAAALARHRMHEEFLRKFEAAVRTQ